MAVNGKVYFEQQNLLLELTRKRNDYNDDKLRSEDALKFFKEVCSCLGDEKKSELAEQIILKILKP